MEFSDKYISVSEKVIIPDDKRTVISDESFAICEMLVVLVNKLEHARLK